MKAENTWQEAAGKRWAELREQTDAQLGPLGRAVMERLAPRSGERVLDVGCGAGDSTFELAERVAPEGSALGIDISPPLLERARERAAERRRQNVDFVLGDAAIEHFDRPFDVLFSRFGVMFFEEPSAAFANLRRALRDGGRLGFVSWQSLDKNPILQVPLSAVQALRPSQPLPDVVKPNAPGMFSLSDPRRVLELLGRAGFEHVHVVEYETEVSFGGARTLAEAVDFALSIGPAARFVADAGLGQDPLVREVIGKALAPYVRERGVWMPARTLIVTASTAP